MLLLFAMTDYQTADLLIIKDMFQPVHPLRASSLTSAFGMPSWFSPTGTVLRYVRPTHKLINCHRRDVAPAEATARDCLRLNADSQPSKRDPHVKA